MLALINFSESFSLVLKHLFILLISLPPFISPPKTPYVLIQAEGVNMRFYGIFGLQDLKNAREDLEKQKKALEVEYNELKRQSISIEAVSTLPSVFMATELPPATPSATSHACGRLGGLMVSALDSGASGLGLSPGRGHCVVFLGKTLTLTVPLSTVYKWVPANCWGNLTNCREVTCDGLASCPGEVGILLTSSRFMLQKLG